MQKIISDNFAGMLALQETEKGYDSFFNINRDIVTLIPLTDDCRKTVYTLSNKDGSNQKDHWLYGITEDSCCIAILKKTPLVVNFSAPIDMNTSKFQTPLIVKSIYPENIDLKTFDSIEFYGGIVDILHPPVLAIDKEPSTNTLIFNNKSEFTKSYDVQINGDNFEMEYSISTADLVLEAGKVPDLRNSIHATFRFNFKKEQQLRDIGKYYSYAMNIFQFCTGRMNVRSEIRLYKKESPHPILVRINDGFDDYSNDVLYFINVIRLSFLADRLPKLAKILNEKNTQPYLLFLPQRNKYTNSITYMNVTDLCVAFDREYSLLETNSKGKEAVAAKSLTNKLLRVIDDMTDCPQTVKSKAKNILNSQLKSFSPSLKEKVISICDKFEEVAKPITERKDHDVFCKIYSKKEFNKKISEFVNIRNNVAHVGIIWNDGTEIFSHLKLFVYFSVLNRADFSPDESSRILSWLFGREF